jgi:hypothetical protein
MCYSVFNLSLLTRLDNYTLPAKGQDEPHLDRLRKRDGSAACTMGGDPLQVLFEFLS